MKVLLKMLNAIFVIFGVLFLVLVIAVSYFWVADPYNLRSLGLSPASVVNSLTGSSKVEIDNIDRNPLLTEEQEAQLESFGINPLTLVL